MNDTSPPSNTILIEYSLEDAQILKHRHRIAPWICIRFAFVSNLARQLIETPSLRVYELGACRADYAKHEPSVIGRDGNVEEHLCKTKEIQHQLAYVIALIETLAIVAGKSLSG